MEMRHKSTNYPPEPIYICGKLKTRPHTVALAQKGVDSTKHKKIRIFLHVVNRYNDLTTKRLLAKRAD